MDERPSSMPRLSATQLKWFAMITMLIDHIAASLLLTALRHMTRDATWTELYRVYRVMRAIGRASFPIYVFLLAEGFFHTHSRARYLRGLSIFALVSELPFDLAFFLTRENLGVGQFFDLEHQNVFFTLAIGLATIWAMETLRPKDGEGQLPTRIVRAMACGLAAAGGCLLARALHTDYGWHGVLAIEMTYLLHPFGYPSLEIGASVLSLAHLTKRELWALPDCLLVALYDGTKGKVRNKWLFYVFYPAHLLVLGIIRVLFVLP